MAVAAMMILAASAPEGRGDEPSDVQVASTMQDVLADAIARAERSVVAIARVRKEPASEALRPEFRPDAFGRRIVAPSPPQPTDANFVPNEYGTGVIIDRRGLVLTAYHVLGEASEYYVTTSGRRIFKASIKAADPRSDLAVLSLDGAETSSASLPPITFGDATTVRKGQIVLTLGNPYAIARDGQTSAGWGIVANLARKAPSTPDDAEPSGPQTLHHFGTLIQTDAKLNLGTSGGPLLNLQGEMIGLCVALAAVPGYESAAGYAIPIDPTFRRVIEVLKEGREVEYGFLGVLPLNLRPREVLGGLQGARIDRVPQGTPAARYGLRADDIITAVGDAKIYDADGLVLEVGRLPVEAVTRLTILRGGRERTIEVKLSKYRVRGKKIVTVRGDAWRGLRTDYPSGFFDADRPALNNLLSDDAVVVSEVEPGTPAAQAGLKRGMLISRVDDQPVRTPKEFQATTAGKRSVVRIQLAMTEGGGAVLVVPPGP
jgi:S1-C subfamily serine protease